MKAKLKTTAIIILTGLSLGLGLRGPKENADYSELVAAFNDIVNINIDLNS